MKDGWKLHQIDEMDIHFYFDLLDTEDEESAEVIQYAEQVPWL